MHGSLLYLDASALVKLVVAESESEGLSTFVGEWRDRITSPSRPWKSREQFGGKPDLASALSVARDVGPFVTYDVRLRDAASGAGLDVQSPA